MTFDVNVDVRLSVEHAGQLPERFLALCIDDGLARLEQQLVTHRHIDLAVLLAYRQLVAAESEQRILHAAEQVLHLLVLLGYHLLQLCDGLLAVLQVGVQLLILVLSAGQQCLKPSDVSLEERRIGHQGIDAFVVHRAVVPTDAKQFGQTVAAVEGGQSAGFGYLELLLAHYARGEQHARHSKHQKT